MLPGTDLHSKFINKIKAIQIDIPESFYSHNNTSDEFITDIDDIWEWCGYNRKNDVKRVLVRNFKENLDYKISLPFKLGQRGGSNRRERILITTKTFKKFCMSSRTSKADEIQDYYIKIEELMYETLKEESLSLQTTIKENIQKSLLDVQSVKEKTLVQQNPENTMCIYYGFIENKSDEGERLIKFGRTNNLKRRVKDHKKTYTNFQLQQVFKVSNSNEIENCIKKHEIVGKRLRKIYIKDRFYVELLSIDCEFTVEVVEEHIKEIIMQTEYNVKNYNLVKSKNQDLENENDLLKAKLMKYENSMLKERLKDLEGKI
jgi:hypothetical protein